MKANNNSYQTQKVIGILLAAPSAAFIAFTLIGGTFMVDGLNLMLGGLMFGAPPLAIGLYLYKNAKNKSKLEKISINEKIVLDLASKNSGILTQTYLAQNSSINLNDAKNILDDFVIKGIAYAEANNNGAVEYHFNDLKIR